MKKHPPALPTVGVILPAAGFGTRMNADRPKQFLELAGKPILFHTITTFLEHSSAPFIAVVLPAGFLQSAQDDILCFFDHDDASRLLFAAGGKTRQESVANGLQILPSCVQYILVHDGARPLVSNSIIDRCLRGIKTHGAVIAAVPVKDTLKKVTENFITKTIERKHLWQAQTPQAMERQLLDNAYIHAEKTGFEGTDEASLLEHAGISVGVVEGSEHNIKITRPGDLAVASGLIHSRSPAMKIGHGYDAHRLVPGRKLILGGVEIAYKLGLEGHSDADVVVHALIDAILGALGAGDIGSHFPDTDKMYKDIDSLKLLEQVIDLAGRQQMRLGNTDITIICQQPKLTPHLEQMQSNIARTCGTTKENVNIKATTTEKMGFTGRGEGISAHAVVLLQQTTT